MTGRRLFLLGSTVVWLAILALIVMSSMDRLSVPPWGNVTGDNRSPEIAGPIEVGQQFTAPYPGLYRIDVTLDPATVQNAHPVSVQLKAEPSAPRAVAVGKFDTRDVQQGVPYSFEFPAVRDSEGRTFSFSLESPQSAPGDAITAHYAPDSVVDGAHAYLNGLPVSGNLKFRTFYTLRTRDKVELLLARMAEGRPYLFGSKGFYVGLTMAYIIVLGIFLWQISQAVLEDEGS